MIVCILSLDSMLSNVKYHKDLKNKVQIATKIKKEFDHVVLLTQDISNFTDFLDGVEHVPCAFSASKRIRWILSSFKYLRWFYFFLYSFSWLLKHRKKIKLLISINVDSPASIFSMIFGIPYIIHYHYDVSFQVMHINKHPILGILLLWLEHFSFRRADAVWVTSPTLAAKVKSYGAKRIKIIPNWIDIQENNQFPKKKSTCFRILFVGRLHPVKQVDLLIKAFHILNKTIPNASLYILGDGEEREKLVTLTKELELNNVYFLGYVDQRTVFQMMKESDALVLPSKIEGNPRVLIEAMVNKVPIIATNVPGIRDMVQHMKTGYLINKQQPEELAYAIEYILKNKKDTANMIERAYVYAKKHFSKESVLQKIHEELKLLLQKY